MSNVTQSVLLQSRIIKNFLIERCTALQVDIVDVAKKSGVNQSLLSAWINAPTPEAMLDMPEQKVIEMLSTVGVDVKVHLVVTPVNEIKDDRMSVIRDLQNKVIN